MKASILIDEESIAADTFGYFSVERGEAATAFQKGLAGTETAVIQLLMADAALDDAVAGDWADYSIDGTVQVLDVNTNARKIDSPGEYRLKIAASAGPVKAGTY